MPNTYREKTWPIFAAMGICLAVMWGLLPVVPGWNLLALPPYFVFLAFWMIRGHRRHKRWMRDMDAWHDRMVTHYLRPFEQRRKAMWS